MHRRKQRPLLDRFWDKVFMEPNSGCWLWGGALTAGYGSIGVGRRGEGTMLAHRLAFEALRGPIPEGMEPDHLCRVPCCVNPWHLELVTRRVNYLRGNHRVAITARTGFCKRGHPFSGENLRTDSYGYRHCRTCDAIHNENLKVRQRLLRKQAKEGFHESA